MSEITINIEKCVGCNSCVKICPAKDANVASYSRELGRTVISIDNSKCIKCGSCIAACSHNARDYEDDTEAFFNALSSGERISIFVAPAIQNTFGDRWQHVLAWLRTRGVTGIYDVSLGADICTWAHLKYVRKNPDAKLVSQPCAAITNYALKQCPGLLKNLSPVHSPMMCTAVYMRNYLGITDKIAAVSPCIAKGDEFAATGIVSYNVTQKRLREYIEAHKVNVSTINITTPVFDGESAYDGVIYPMPGGLKLNLLAHAPRLNVINSEGVEKVYHELEEYIHAPETDLPTVFDVLNCEFGCNEGPGIGQKFETFRISNIMFKRSLVSGKRRRHKSLLGIDRQFASFNRRFRLEDFIRQYTANSSKHIPDNRELDYAFRALKKNTQTERNFNCHACGFDTCTDMAAAIARGINVPENCRMYLMKVSEQQSMRVSEINRNVLNMTKELASVFETLIANITGVKNEAVEIAKYSEEGANSMNTVNTGIMGLGDLNKSIVDGIHNINEATDNYRKMTENVKSIADTISILAVNASIEAARAGDAGKSFAIVARNVKDLALTSLGSVDDAEINDKRVEEAISRINEIVSDFVNQSEELSERTKGLISSVENTTERSHIIMSSMEELSQLAAHVNTMITNTEKMLQE